MNCDRIEELVSAEIAAEISTADARALAEHIASCESCRALAEDFRRQDREMTEAFAARRRVADELGERLAGSFASTPPLSAARGGRSLSPRLLALAAALVVGFALGWATLSLLRSGPPAGENGALTQEASTAARLARLAFATGPVELLTLGAAEWLALSPDDPVPAGARVRCAPESLCELEASDGSVLRLDRGAEMRLVGARDVELLRGRVGTRVARGMVPFGVRVAEATVTALGTRFDLSRSGAEATLSVFEGATRVQVGEETRVVRRGEEARVDKDIRVRKIDPLRFVQAASWMNALLTLEARRDDGEVDRRLDELLVGLGQTKMDLLYEQEIRELGASCVVPLSRYIASPRSLESSAKRRRAARIVADLATDKSIDDLIELLSDDDGAVRSAAARGLERLTGENQGLPAASWSAANWSACESAYLGWIEWARSRAGDDLK